MPRDFIDPAVAAFFASREGTPAMALYGRWKAGETCRVRTTTPLPGETPVEFEIVPARYFDCGPVVGLTIQVNGKPVPGYRRKCMRDSQFLEWCETLEAVEVEQREIR